MLTKSTILDPPGIKIFHSNHIFLVHHWVVILPLLCRIIIIWFILYNGMLFLATGAIGFNWLGIDFIVVFLYLHGYVQECSSMSHIRHYFHGCISLSPRFYAQFLLVTSYTFLIDNNAVKIWTYNNQVHEKIACRWFRNMYNMAVTSTIDIRMVVR